MAHSVGGGYLNRPASLDEEFPARFGVLTFLRQAVRFAPGETTERGVTFHAFLLFESGDMRELESSDRARLVRAIYRAPRVRDPQAAALAQSMSEKEVEIAAQLRSLSEDERAEGVRPAVWPVAAFVVG
jgi:hypothetical protein